MHSLMFAAGLMGESNCELRRCATMTCQDASFSRTCIHKEQGATLQLCKSYHAPQALRTACCLFAALQSRALQQARIAAAATTEGRVDTYLRPRGLGLEGCCCVGELASLTAPCCALSSASPPAAGPPCRTALRLLHSSTTTLSGSKACISAPG